MGTLQEQIPKGAPEVRNLLQAVLQKFTEISVFFQRSFRIFKHSALMEEVSRLSGTSSCRLPGVSLGTFNDETYQRPPPPYTGTEQDTVTTPAPSEGSVMHLPGRPRTGDGQGYTEVDIPRDLIRPMTDGACTSSKFIT